MRIYGGRPAACDARDGIGGGLITTSRQPLGDRLRAHARVVARAAGISAWTAANLGAHGVRERFGNAEARLDSNVRRWARGLLRITGVRIHRADSLPPEPQRARLVVANHRSALDIPILLSLFGGCVLSKAELEDMPLIGPSAREAGCIFVDREDPRSGVAAMRQIRERLREGKTVCVFPEGTTFAGDEVRPLNRGALSAARGLDVELVLVGIAHPPGTEFTEDAFNDHLANVAGQRVLQVGVAFGEPRTLPRNTKAFLPELHTELQALVHRARRAVP